MFKKVLLISAIFILGSFIESTSLACFSGPNSDSPARQEKQKRWVEKETEVEGWRDALGLPIDPGIKRTVIVLNLLGLETYQSCEGHIDGHSPYPWVSLEVRSKESEALVEEMGPLWNAKNQLFSKIMSKHPGISYKQFESLSSEQEEEMPHYRALESKYSQLLALKSKLEEPVLRKNLIPLQSLLRRFYSNRSPEYGLQLVTDFERLRSLDVDYIDRPFSPERLEKHQKEMAAFTDFLVEIYCSE